MKNKKMLLLLLLITAGSLMLSGCASRAMLNNAFSWPGLSAEDDVAYVAYGNTVQAVAGGKALWKYPLEPDRGLMFFAAPAIDKDRIYAGSYSNEVHVLNKADGSFRAKIVLPSNKSKIVASPVITEEMLYIPSSNGTIYAYSLDNLNAEKWHAKLGNEVWSSPLPIGDELYVFSLDKHLNVLDIETGEIKKVLDVNGAVLSDPVKNGEKIYFTTFGKEVDSFDPASGEISKLFDTTGEAWAAPLIVDDLIIVADMAGNVYCHDLTSGASKWTLTNVTGEGKGVIANPLLLSDGNLLITTETGDLLVYDQDGKSVNTRSTKSKLLTSPVVMGDSVVTAVVPGDSLLRVYTFDLKEDWIYMDTAQSGQTPETNTESVPEATGTPAK